MLLIRIKINIKTTFFGKHEQQEKKLLGFTTRQWSKVHCALLPYINCKKVAIILVVRNLPKVSRKKIKYAWMLKKWVDF